MAEGKTHNIQSYTFLGGTYNGMFRLGFVWTFADRKLWQGRTQKE